MNSCPNCHQGLHVSNCHQGLHVSNCHQASLLYCSDCQWGLISFDQDIDKLMEMEEEQMPPLFEPEEAYLLEALAV